MMRKIILMAVSLLITATSFAQNNPVSWRYSINDLGEDMRQIVIEAKIEAGYHLYDMGPYSGGPNATVFTFDIQGDASLVGQVEYLTQPHRAYDPSFDMDVGSFEGSARFSQKIKLSGDASVKLNIEWMCCNDVSCIPPTDTDFVINLGDNPAASQKEEAPTSENTSGKDSESSLWILILQAIAWGIAALATPCVFPMIPMTVSFFIKGSSNKALGRFRALMYGLFIVALYTVPIALIIFITWIIGGDAVTADIFNWLSTHWLPNIIFFIVFMVFAASFFGAFEIVMPSKLVNKSDQNSDKKGLGGIFFMALTLVLVSFSCTGPIVGTVLIKSTSGEFWTPMLTMLAFSIAFALPFTLFALFPSWLKKLPKSGGWLNSVKVVLGFIEIALGLKFLSTADQTYQWGLLDREVYLAIWIVCFTLLGFYLLGKIRFKNDDIIEHVSVLRLSLAIASFSFVVYMLPGMWGAPLKAISGYLPPMQTQDFVLGRESATTGISQEQAQGHQVFSDLAQAQAFAEKADKPLFINFTGLGCMNCREMEARVLSDSQITEMLRNDYVVVDLFGDDKREAPESSWITTENGKVLKTAGKINSYYVLKEYGINAQPYYILKGHGRLLSQPRSYNLDVEAFREFLRKGLEEYRSAK